MDEGFIEHDGRGMPVDADVIIEVIKTNGYRSSAAPAGWFNAMPGSPFEWGVARATDILFYKIVGDEK